MGIRRRVRQSFKLIIIFSFNLLLSSVNYQILDIPHTIYSLSYNNSIIEKKDENQYKYQTNFFIYPGNIFFSNIYSKSNVSFHFLDYGMIEDKINDDIINQDYAYETLIKFHYTNNKKYKLELQPGILHSRIGSLTSTAITINILLEKKINLDNTSIKMGINNLGFIINEYLNQEEYLPHNTQIGIKKYFKDNKLTISYDFINLKYNANKHILSFQKDLNQNTSFLYTINSYKKDLQNNNVINNFFAGSSLGLMLQYEKINAHFGIGSLGPAGYFYGVSLSFK